MASSVSNWKPAVRFLFHGTPRIHKWQSYLAKGIQARGADYHDVPEGRGAFLTASPKEAKGYAETGGGIGEAPRKVYPGIVVVDRQKLRKSGLKLYRDYGVEGMDPKKANFWTRKRIPASAIAAIIHPQSLYAKEPTELARRMARYIPWKRSNPGGPQAGYERTGRWTKQGKGGRRETEQEEFDRLFREAFAKKGPVTKRHH